MTNEAIFALLKFSGPVVGLISALWSTTQKITYETADGAKRLTLQGRVLIGITVAAALISILALGFEAVIGEQRAQQAAAKEAADARRVADKEARTKAEAAARDQAAAFARLEADAAEQKRFLEQRFLIIGAAAEQQRRDAQMSMQIAREANQRLSEAARTFAEFERINYPLRNVAVWISVAINLEGLDTSGFWERIKGLRGVEGLRWTQTRRGEPAEIVTFQYAEIRERGADPGQVIGVAVQGIYMDVAFVAPEDAPAVGGGATDEIKPVDVATYPDAPFSIPLGSPHIEGSRQIEADIGKRTIWVTLVGAYEPAVEGVIGSGDKLSLADVDRLVPILTIKRLDTPRRPRGPDILRGVSFSLNGQERFRTAPGFRIAGTQAFILSPKRRR